MLMPRESGASLRVGVMPMLNRWLDLVADLTRWWQWSAMTGAVTSHSKTATVPVLDKAMAEVTA